MGRAGECGGPRYDALRGASRVVRHLELRTIGVRLANEIHYHDPWSGLALQGLGLEACAMIGRADANGDLASPRAIVRILELLDADPAADLTIERIASPSERARRTSLARFDAMPASGSRSSCAASVSTASALSSRRASSPLRTSRCEPGTTIKAI